MEKKILVGVITAAHGIKGAVIIKSFTDPITNLCNLSLVTEEGKNIKCKLISKKTSKLNTLICAVENIHDRNQAEMMKGMKLYCLRFNMPPVDTDEFYIADLINLPVMTNNLELIGIVKNVFNFGAGDIIEIEIDSGDIKNNLQLFPFTHQYFPVITASYIILDAVIDDQK